MITSTVMLSVTKHPVRIEFWILHYVQNDGVYCKWLITLTYARVHLALQNVLYRPFHAGCRAAVLTNEGNHLVLASKNLVDNP